VGGGAGRGIRIAYQGALIFFFSLIQSEKRKKKNTRTKNRQKETKSQGNREVVRDRLPLQIASGGAFQIEGVERRGGGQPAEEEKPLKRAREAGWLRKKGYLVPSLKPVRWGEVLGSKLWGGLAESSPREGSRLAYARRENRRLGGGKESPLFLCGVQKARIRRHAGGKRKSKGKRRGKKKKTDCETVVGDQTRK